MSAEHRNSSIIQRLKGLVPLFGKSVPVVELPTSHDLEPPADVMVVAKVEQPPVLTPFQQLERFLEQQSGISDPLEDGWRDRPRSMKKQKQVGERRLFITIVQKTFSKWGPREYGWEPKITVSLFLEDTPGWALVEDYRRRGIKMGLGWNPTRDVSGGLVVSADEITINFGTHTYTPTNSPLWQVLHFPELPKWPEWEHKIAGRQEVWSTNSEDVMAKVTQILTKD